MNKKQVKRQIKKDKARLNELKRLHKQNALSIEETLEYTRLLNENTDRTWKHTEKLQKVALVFLGLSCVIEIIALLVAILTVFKH